MFETLGGFSAVYFTLSAILIALVLFEKQALQLEEKYDKWRSNKIKERRAKHENRGAAQGAKGLQEKM